MLTQLPEADVLTNCFSRFGRCAVRVMAPKGQPFVCGCFGQLSSLVAFLLNLQRRLFFHPFSLHSGGEQLTHAMQLSLPKGREPMAICGAKAPRVPGERDRDKLSASPTGGLEVGGNPSTSG